MVPTRKIRFVPLYLFEVIDFYSLKRIAPSFPLTDNPSTVSTDTDQIKSGMYYRVPVSCVNEITKKTSRYFVERQLKRINNVFIYIICGLFYVQPTKPMVPMYFSVGF